MKKEFIENLKSLGNVTVTQNADGSILISPIKDEKESLLKIDSRTAVHCETEELSKAVLDVSDNIGKCNCKNFSGFGYCKDQTCYVFAKHNAMCARLDYLKEKGYNIISAKEFLKLHNAYYSYLEFKDGDIIIDRSSRAHGIAILKGGFNYGNFNDYASINYSNKLNVSAIEGDRWDTGTQSWDFSTEEEKKVLFDRLAEEKGLVWDAEKKKLEPICVKKIWENIGEIDGYCVRKESDIWEVKKLRIREIQKNVAASKKVCKAMLAMAQISQVLEKWYNPFTEEEVEDKSINKYSIGYSGEKLIIFRNYDEASLSFRSKSDAEEFLSFEENKKLVLDYFMINHD